MGEYPPDFSRAGRVSIPVRKTPFSGRGDPPEKSARPYETYLDGVAGGYAGGCEKPENIP
jgi:hypothetical protein